MQVNMLDAKSQLSKLVKAALEGEDVIIANNGVPAVKLVPMTAARPVRRPGAWAHLKVSEAQIADAFSAETNAGIAQLFELEMPRLAAATIPAKTTRTAAGKTRRK